MGRKTNVGHFKRRTSEISNKKTLTWLRKGNFKRETESFQIAAQNNTISTKYVKVKIDKMQQNSTWRFCDDKDKTINPIKSECCKLLQSEYKTRHELVGKWSTGMHKMFKLNHTNKWFMHNAKYVLEN